MFRLLTPPARASTCRHGPLPLGSIRLLNVKEMAADVPRPASSSRPFHEGELDVQQRAGVRYEAERLSGMLAAPHLDGGMSRFLAEREIAMITSRDAANRLWTSPLLGTAGFLQAHAATVTIRSIPSAGDPLHELRNGQFAGLLAIDFGRKRRLRVNGTLTHVSPGGAQIVADQAFGNCPRYITQRQVRHGCTLHGDPPVTARRHNTLEPEDIALIARADTFILGTMHPARGADTSHRGGAPGFVRVENGDIWWPDYPGNNLFNSLGNIVVDPSAALLFLDFEAGAALQISGKANLEWISPEAVGDDRETGRRTRFKPSEVVTVTGLSPRALDHNT